MKRIEDEKADAALASLKMARATLKAGRPEDAVHALETALGLLDEGLEPSRAPRGNARGEPTGRNRAKARESAQ